MARKVSPVHEEIHDDFIPPAAAERWNAHELSLDNGKDESTDLQEWSELDFLGAEALVDGLVQEEPSIRDIGRTHLWEAADSGASTGASTKLFLPGISSWLPNTGKGPDHGNKARSELTGYALVLEPPIHISHNLPATSFCIGADSHGTDTSSPREGTRGPGDGFDDDTIRKSSSRSALGVHRASRVSLNTVSPTSSQRCISSEDLTLAVACSPASLAEDMVSFLDTESPSPPTVSTDRRQGLLTSEGGRHERGRTLDASSVETEVTMVIPPRAADHRSGDRTGNIPEDSSDDHYQDMHSYIDSQHAFLRKKELEMTVRSGYLDGPDRPGTVTAATRVALLDWLERLHQTLPTICENGPKLSLASLFLAANILDRFVSTPEARRKLLEGNWGLEIAAASALSLALKFEDAQVPSLWAIALASKLAGRGSSGTELCVRCKWISSEARSAASPCRCDVCEARRALRRVEELVTSALSFRMMAPTVLSFLRIYLVRAQRLGHLQSSEAMEEVHSEAIDILWIVVRDASSLTYRPSELAASALYLASYRTSVSKPLSFDLLAITGIEVAQLQECLRNMRRVEAAVSWLKRDNKVSDSGGSCLSGGSPGNGAPGTRGVGPGGFRCGGFVGGDPGAPHAECVGGFGRGCCRGGGLEVSGIEVGDDFLDSILRLGGVEPDSGFGSGASRCKGPEASEVEVGDAFVASVLRLGGVETESGSGSDGPRVDRMEPGVTFHGSGLDPICFVRGSRASASPYGGGSPVSIGDNPTRNFGNLAGSGGVSGAYLTSDGDGLAGNSRDCSSAAVSDESVDARDLDVCSSCGEAAAGPLSRRSIRAASARPRDRTTHANSLIRPGDGCSVIMAS